METVKTQAEKFYKIWPWLWRIAYVFGVGVLVPDIANLWLILLFAVMPVHLILRFLRKLLGLRAPSSKEQTIAILATIVAMAAAGFCINLQRDVANANMRKIGRAINHYHASHGHYPRDLRELVPSELPSVPKAGWPVTRRTFRYDLPNIAVTEGSERVPTPILMFTHFSPFGRSTYNFETDQIVGLD